MSTHGRIDSQGYYRVHTESQCSVEGTKRIKKIWHLWKEKTVYVAGWFFYHALNASKQISAENHYIKSLNPTKNCRSKHWKLQWKYIKKYFSFTNVTNLSKSQSTRKHIHFWLLKGKYNKIWLFKIRHITFIEFMNDVSSTKPWMFQIWS